MSTREQLQPRIANTPVRMPSPAKPANERKPAADGHPLDAATRAHFEPRFGHDFSKVRVHTDSGLRSRAYASGGDIVFAPGHFRPGTEDGRRLLGHELAHVVQQTMSGHAASTSDLEREASRASEAASHGADARIRLGAKRDAQLFETRNENGKVFQIGDVKLDAGASADVRTHGVLLPGPDQAHIVVTRGDNRLGYETAYTTPDDPFRFSHLKEIVDSGSLDIFTATPSSTIPVKVATQTTEKVEKMSLTELAMRQGGLFAGGVTLPRLPALKAANPGVAVMYASSVDSRDQIYYDASGGGGHGALGTNSLAHEFYGHLYLSRKGVPSGHGQQINANAGILDPQGRPYQGSVDDYISHYAGVSGTANQSPTQGVGPALQEQTLRSLNQNGGSGLTRQPNNRYTVSKQFSDLWERLSGEYSVVRFQHANDVEPSTSTATSVSTAAGMRSRVMTWYGALTEDQKWVFRGFVNDLTKSWSAPGNRRSELAADIQPQLNTP